MQNQRRLGVREVKQRTRPRESDGAIGADRDVRARLGDPPVLVSDSSKARELMGWTPKFPELDR